MLWHCWLGNRKSIWPLKAPASKHLGMAVNVSGQDTAWSTMRLWKAFSFLENYYHSALEWLEKAGSTYNVRPHISWLDTVKNSRITYHPTTSVWKMPLSWRWTGHSGDYWQQASGAMHSNGASRMVMMMMMLFEEYGWLETEKWKMAV